MLIHFEHWIIKNNFNKNKTVLIIKLIILQIIIEKIKINYLLLINFSQKLLINIIK